MDDLRQEEIAKQLRRLKAISTGGIKSFEDLKERVFEYISYHMSENCASKLRTLNRRFGVAAHKVGHTIAEVTQSLVVEDKIVCVERGGSELVITRDYMNMMERVFPDSVECQNALDRILVHAK